MMRRKLSTFHGGLKLDGHKAMSKQQPIRSAALPRQLILPVQQHIGRAPEILVSVGDPVLKGQMLARPEDEISASLHAPTSGTIIDISEYAIPHPSGLPAMCIVLESDGQDAWCERQPMGDNYQHKTSDELLKLIRHAGIVGLGGAVFPTAVKLAGGVKKHIHTLIINGAECEPYISCDDMLMQERAEQILRGAAIIQHIVQAEQVLIAVEDNKPEAIDELQKALRDTDLKQIKIMTIPTIYPTGGEKQLIQVLTGKEVPRHQLPADMGILCQNVGTAAAVYRAVYHDEPLISRIITVTGDGVEQPANLEVLLGTPIAELVSQCGGYHNDVEQLIMGGPMMGFSLSSDELPVIKATNCILARQRKTAQISNGVMPCIRCGECVKVCPAKLLPQQLYWYASAKNFDRAQDLNLFDCIECGCCSYVCPSHIPLVQYYRYAKTEIWTAEREKIKSDHARRRHEFREERIEREKREREEKMRKKKEMLAKKKQQEGDKTEAPDPKKAAIEAALARVKAKKEAMHIEPKNTENLTADQQKQIEEAQKRRKTSHDQAGDAS